MKALDRTFGCLLILGSFGHAFGSYAAYHNKPPLLLWAFSASFAGLLLAAINLLRTSRPGDIALACISFAGSVVWMGFVFWFGIILGSMLDFHVSVNLVIAVVLAGFSLNSVLRRPSTYSRPAASAASSARAR